jgi:two-component system chemotaxis sensor kinase CheA
MIDDKELREIFKVESGEHIQRLEDGFLRLEKEPGNATVLEEVFREAHSLKGAARMIGLTGIEKISHRLEDILGSAGKGLVPLSSEIIDSLCAGLDAIRELVQEAVSGEPANISVSQVLEKLKTGLEKILKHPGISEDTVDRQAPMAATEASVVAARSPADYVQAEAAPPTEVKEAPVEEFRIATIRVETDRLDELMAQTGELNVTKLRIAQRVADIKGLMMLWEEGAGSLVKLARGSTGLIKEEAAIQILTAKNEQLGVGLNAFMKAISEDNARLDFAGSELEENISRIRLLPLSTIFNLYQRLVRDLARDQGKEVSLIIEGGETGADKRIIEEMKDPLMHMVRNAIDHGIELPAERERQNKPRAGAITLKAYQTPASVVVEVHDDGQGLDLEALKRSVLKRKIVSASELAAMSPAQVTSLIFLSGVSTSAFVSDVSGRGVGLDVVRAGVERLKGSIAVESPAAGGCLIRIKLPLTLATSRVILVAVNNMKYAIPVEHIQTTCLVKRRDLFTLEGRQAMVFKQRPVPVAALAALLELPGAKPEGRDHFPQSPSHIRQSENIPCLILVSGDDFVGVLVDELIDELEIVLKPSGSILKRTRNVSGATILGTGEVCMILNTFDLIRSAKKKDALPTPEKPGAEAEATKSILVAEDSLTVRTQMKRILEGAGYEVVVAVDGADAFNKLADRSFAALVSDIMMPNMSGLELTEKIRRNKKYQEMPVVLVTSLASDEDKQKGLAAGANAYISKPSFDQKVLLDTLRRLI